MSNTWPYEDAMNATRESIDAYFQAAIQNPPMETTHSVNLGSIASRLNVELDVHDLTAAVEHVNEQHNVVPPIKVLGKIASEDSHSETYYTSAKGLHKTFVWVQLRSIALGKLQAKSSGNL
jgi:hypothetical protein